MLVTNHAAVGALIGILLPTHPILAFFLAFGSHFAMDAIPHGDSGMYEGYTSGTNKKSAIAITILDSISAMLVVLLVIHLRPTSVETAISMGVAGSIFPDFIVAIYELTHWKALHWFHRLHFFFHNAITRRIGDLPFSVGLSMELLVLILLLFRIV